MHTLFVFISSEKKERKNQNITTDIIQYLPCERSLNSSVSSIIEPYTCDKSMYEVT